MLSLLLTSTHEQMLCRKHPFPGGETCELTQLVPASAYSKVEGLGLSEAHLVLIRSSTLLPRPDFSPWNIWYVIPSAVVIPSALPRLIPSEARDLLYHPDCGS